MSPGIARVRLAACCIILGLAASAPRVAAAQAPRLDASSRVRIGSADGEAAYLLNRIATALRLSTGEIVIADRGTSQLRWFSPTGTWLRSVGREGSGPGEFRGLRSLLLLPGDSLLAEDGLEARMTLYDRTSRLVRSWQISAAGSFITPPPIGRLPDGSFVAPTERELSPPPGHSHYQAILIRYRDGAIIDTLATARGGESFSVPCGTATQPGICGMGVPYGVRSLAAVVRDRVFVGNGERYELVRIDATSGKTDTLRREVPAVPLDAARRAYFVDSITVGLPEARRAVVRDRFSGAPARRTMPAFDALIADDAGRLWLARPQERGAAERRWDLLDEGGRFVGTVALPSALKVTHIAGGYVVGISRDADGVEYVEVYRLR